MTTLTLPRCTRGSAPDARTLARLIAHDCGKPLSWEFNRHITVDTNRSILVVDLDGADPARAADACRNRCDRYDIEWEIR